MDLIQPELADLASQARTRDPAVRARLALTLADAYERGPIEHAATAVSVERLLTEFVRQAAEDVRLAIAERLAGIDWAPHDLIVELAHDAIDVARPVIARSRSLLEADLIALSRAASEDHVVEVAKRPDLTAGVCDAIADRGVVKALHALISNTTAEPSLRAFDAAVAAAATHPPLRQPLSVHKLLPSHLATKLYAIVGEELRAAISGRFQIDPEALDHAIAEATALSGRGDLAQDAFDGAALVERLERSGALTPGFALRAVLDGRIGLFELSLARLAGITVSECRAAIEAGGAWAAALACRAAGIDKAAFTSVYRGLAAVGRLPAKPTPDIARRAAAVFETHSREAAGETLRRLAGAD